MKYLFLVFCLILGSCAFDDASSGDGFYFDEAKFMSEWNIWKNQDIKDYSFALKGELPYWHYPRKIIQVILMYDYDVNIMVKNGIMDSFEYIGRTPYQERNSEAILVPEYTSMSDMYQKIYDSIKDCERYWKETTDKGCFVSKRYEIEYDPEFHHITYFKPVTKVAPGCLLDTTEHEIVVSDFSKSAVY